MKIDRGHGAATWVAPRRDGGVTIHQGASRVYLAPDELDAVLDAVYTMTGRSAQPVGAEKTTPVETTVD